MALNISAPFKRGGAFPIDEDLIKTKAEMLAVDDNVMPSDYFCLCSEDGKIYIYKKSNTADQTTGKYRVLESEGNTVSVELTKAQFDALTPEAKMSGIVYYITDWNGGGGSLPAGGTTGQALVKKSNADGDVEWKNAGSDIVIFNVNSTVYSYNDFYDVINNPRPAYIQGIDSLEPVVYIEGYMEGVVIATIANSSLVTYYWSSDGSGDYKLLPGQSRPFAFSNEIIKTYRVGPTYKYDFNDVAAQALWLSRIMRIQNSEGKNILISSSYQTGQGGIDAVIHCHGTDGEKIYTFTMTQNLDPDDNTSYFVEQPVQEVNVLTAPNGTKYRLKVANDGTLSTEAV